MHLSTHEGTSYQPQDTEPWTICEVPWGGLGE
jgi:hypothetical protein